MPIYEYECDHCHHRFEVRQGFKDKPQAKCPKCQEIARRVFHPTPIIFKGSGFYVTDHRPAESKTEPKPPKGETEASKKSK
jgi:putative FmdB family regulatory protein